MCDTRVCKDCKKEKELTYFPSRKHQNNKTYYSHICKKCTNENRKASQSRWTKKQIDELSDSYITKVLKRRFKTSGKEITVELINTYRDSLKQKRLIKETVKKHENHRNCIKCKKILPLNMFRTRKLKYKTKDNVEKVSKTFYTICNKCVPVQSKTMRDNNIDEYRRREREHLKKIRTLCSDRYIKTTLVYNIKYKDITQEMVDIKRKCIQLKNC